MFTVEFARAEDGDFARGSGGASVSRSRRSLAQAQALGGEGQASTATPASPTATAAFVPPIFAQFATTPATPNYPTLVAVVPRKASRSAASESDSSAALGAPSPGAKAPAAQAMQPTAPALAPAPAPAPPPAAEAADEQPSDGPLFRALIGSLEKRALVLRSSIKQLVKSLDTSLAALQANTAAQASVDDALESLSSASSGLLKSEVLGGIYAELLARERARTRQVRQNEIGALEELIDRLKGSSDRLKLQDGRRKEFEGASKSYYDGLTKYLARSEGEGHKRATLDSKQATRALEFDQIRTDYSGWLEGLVETEEGAVALWLKRWAGVPESQTPISVTEDERRRAREKQQRTLTQSMRASISLLPAFNDGPQSPVPDDDVSDSGVFSDGGISNASNGDRVSFTNKKHRHSIPSFPSEFHREGGTRDNIKRFLKSAQSSISSAMPSQSTPLGPPTRIPSGGSGSNVPPPASTPPSNSLQPPVTPSTKQQMESAQRKKEGFLYVNSKTRGTSDFKSADNGGSWHKHWVVLAEGQLAEFSHWRSQLSMRATPLSLQAATVKLPRGSDRRFTLEIVTPTTRRTYQALSEPERDAWVTAINHSIESVLTGKSTVRHFDASKLTGTSNTPYSLQSLASSSTLSFFSSDNPSSTPSSSRDKFANRLPNWMAPPLSRRASSGAKSRTKHSSTPSLQGAPTVLVTDASPSQPLSRRKHQSTASESGFRSFSDPRRPSGDFAYLHERRSPSVGSEAAESDGGATAPSDDDSSVGHDGREILAGVDRLVLTNGTTPLEDLRDGKMRRAGEILALAEQEGNATCADCGAADPKWASWNLGVFLCIRCSGVHRSLGTHISKVRSIELDDWSAEQLAAMREGGNEKANERWLPQRPLALEPTDANIAEYIKRKYSGEWADQTLATSASSQLSAIPEAH